MGHILEAAVKVSFELCVQPGPASHNETKKREVREEVSNRKEKGPELCRNRYWKTELCGGWDREL